MVFDPEYAPVPEIDARSEPVRSFMVDCLLRSRIETGLGAAPGAPDDDVNVYLAHLLTALLDPRYHERASRFVSPYESDLSTMLDGAPDRRHKYDVYRTNADHLLTMLGIFGGLQGKFPASPLAIPEGVFVGRGKAYYDFASVYSEALPDGARGVTEVLRKLSEGFESYLGVLRHTRSTYLNLIDRLSSGEWYHLERSISESEAGNAPPAGPTETAAALKDRLLDLILEQRAAPSPELSARIFDVVRQIREIDPRFGYPARD
jgi:hypothetical protein